MNKIIKNALILAAITLIAGLLLGAAHQVTLEPIQKQQENCLLYTSDAADEL